MNLYAITINDLASRRVAEISHRLSPMRSPAGKSLADLSAQRLGAIEVQMQDLARSSPGILSSGGYPVLPLND